MRTQCFHGYGPGSIHDQGTKILKAVWSLLVQVLLRFILLPEASPSFLSLLSEHQPVSGFGVTEWLSGSEPRSPAQARAGRGVANKARAPSSTGPLLGLLGLGWEPHAPDGQAHLPATESHCFAAVAHQLPSSSTELWESVTVVAIPICILGLSRWFSDKECAPMQELQEMLARSLGREDPLEEEIANHSGILFVFSYYSWGSQWKNAELVYIPSPVGHILSELPTMTRLSWVALHGMAHSFIGLPSIWSI